MTNLVISPHVPFTDIDGSPLNEGFIFIGEKDKDPTLFPIAVYWDEAKTLPVMQPIRTKNGFVVNGDSFAKIFIEVESCSVLVKNRNQSNIYFEQNSPQFTSVSSASGLVQTEKSRAMAAETALSTSITTEANRATAAETLLQTQINANGVGNRAYLTYAAMNADKVNIPAKSKVTVTNDPTTSNNGDWQYDGTNFTKSTYDPVLQANTYTQQYVAANALSVKPNLTTEDLNTVTTIGIYHQPSDANATLANNYPDTRAGTLEVIERSGFLIQEYTTWFGRKFWRTKQGSNPMQLWQEVTTVANFESKALIVKPNLATENLNTVLDRGIYRQPSNTNGSIANGYPEDSASGILRVYSTDANYTVQEYTTWVGNKYWRSKYTTNNFTVWKKVATQAQIDEALSRKANLSTEDLNTVLTYGIYRQPSDANATLANNYPDTRAGTLEVIEGGGFVIQEYTTWFGRKFYRTKQGSNAIQPWQEYAKMSNIDLVAPYKGKNFAWFGDSIVNGNNHPNRIAANLQATVSKFGFNSCTMSKNAGSPNGYDKLTMYRFGHAINTGDFSEVVAGAQWIKDNSGPDFTPQANAMAVMDWNTVDYIMIAFGTNDWAGSTPLGDTYVADPNGETYIGAACYAIEQIQTRYPHIQIMFIGMPFRTRWFQTPVPDRPDQNSDNTPDAQGKILVDYENALVEIGKKYHVPVFEFNKRSDINAMTYTNYYTDGVHPKENGIQLLTKKIGAFLMNN